MCLYLHHLPSYLSVSSLERSHSSNFSSKAERAISTTTAVTYLRTTARGSFRDGRDRPLLVFGHVTTLHLRPTSDFTITSGSHFSTVQLRIIVYWILTAPVALLPEGINTVPFLSFMFPQGYSCCLPNESRIQTTNCVHPGYTKYTFSSPEGRYCLQSVSQA